MRVVFVTVGSWAGLLAVGAVLEALGLLYPPLRSLAALWALAVMLLGPFLLVPLHLHWQPPKVASVLLAFTTGLFVWLAAASSLLVYHVHASL